MKQIGLLGGTSWPSTIAYYRLLNQMASERLGGNHSANLLLKSIDYHAIKSRYHAGWEHIPSLLKQEVAELVACKPDCLILCNNTLHKAYDAIAGELRLSIPFFHAVDLTAATVVKRGYRKLLLLATQFTMEDGYYRRKLESNGLEVTIPSLEERCEIQLIQQVLASGDVKPIHREYFRHLIAGYAQLDAVILACTELPLAISQTDSALPILNPTLLQCQAATDFAIS